MVALVQPVFFLGRKEELRSSSGHMDAIERLYKYMVSACTCAWSVQACNSKAHTVCAENVSDHHLQPINTQATLPLSPAQATLPKPTFPPSHSAPIVPAATKLSLQRTRILSRLLYRISHGMAQVRPS